MNFYKDADGKAVPSTAGNHDTATSGVAQSESKSTFQTVGRQADLLAKGEGRSDRITRLAAIKRRRAGGASE